MSAIKFTAHTIAADKTALSLFGVFDQPGSMPAPFLSPLAGKGGTLFFDLGTRERFSLSALREALTAAFKAAKKAKVKDLVIAPLSLQGTGITPVQFGEAVAQFACLVDYELNHFKTKQGGHKPETHFSCIQVQTDSASLESVRSGLFAGQVIASAVNDTRNLVNLPPSICTPSYLAAQARKLSKRTRNAVKVRVLSRNECQRLGMNAFLAVSRGSSQPPQFIELSYEPENAVPDIVLGLVGKSITFDSGGLDLKSAAGMLDMKCDMAGGATVLSAIGAIATLKLPVRVKAFMAATENLLGPAAYKPSDIIRTMKGLTVEVGNTDAEGRLTLVDAIEFAVRSGVSHIVDLATLTGAILTSLADVGAGLFGNDPFWSLTVKDAAISQDELVWGMPMWPALKKANETPMADLKNTGGSFGAGSSTAALFIAPFAGKTPWVHLDIAGVAHRSRELGADPKGGTGWGVRTLVALARQLAESSQRA